VPDVPLRVPLERTAARPPGRFADVAIDLSRRFGWGNGRSRAGVMLA
jgi:hypothetical protein